MNLSNQAMSQVIQKFFDLYIVNYNKYLIMNQKGTYTTLNAESNKKIKRFGKWQIQEHLKGSSTYGVFSGDYISSFICFDIDVPEPLNARWTVYYLIDTLIHIGIPEDYIYISSSGNKGYHVDIYFNNPLYNNLIQDFYNIVMSKLDLSLIKGQIELRPTKEHGLKLPLGRNYKNKNASTNKCWYVNYDDQLKPIRRLKYILDIKQMDISIIKEIIENEKEITVFDIEVDKEEALQIESTKAYLDTKYKPLATYQRNIDNQSTIEEAERLENEGLTQTGTRHNSLYLLAKYYKYNDYSQQENENSLIEWMSNQDTRFYNTSFKDCIKDIKEIVTYIYDKDISLVSERKEIKIHYDEMQFIIKAKSKNEKLLLYALIIHHKRYESKTGIFYMTYNQMSKSTGLSLRTVKRLIDKLNDSNLIEIVERNRKVFDEKGRLLTKRPNKYKVLSPVINNDIGKYITMTDSIVEFNELLLMFYDKSTLKSILPYRHYYELD